MASSRFLSKDLAQKIDQELFQCGYSLDQLMELAGKAVADVIASLYSKLEYSKPLIIIGPGNNGGDGLVASRYLSQYGFDPVVCIPKWPSKFENLVKLCENYNIPILKGWEEGTISKLSPSLIVDAIFGFSFEGSIRSPYDRCIKEMSTFKGPLVSIDIPSGWIIDDETQDEKEIDVLLKPETLISLTLPKICAKGFKGKHHYIGGSFVPPSLEMKFQIKVPQYGINSFLNFNQWKD